MAMSKVLVSVHLEPEQVAKLDRLAKGSGVTAPTTRSKQAGFMLARAIDAVDEGAAKPRKIIARPFPKDGATVLVTHPAMEMASKAMAAEHEGAHLKAARVAAGLTQPGLAAAVSSESVQVSRPQVERAERAASLDAWPALRAWLLEYEAKALREPSG
jgi:hypothetical protein